MAYEQSGLFSLDIVVALLDDSDRGRALMAERVGLRTRVLNERMDDDLANAGPTLLVLDRRKDKVLDTVTVSWALWDTLINERRVQEVFADVTDCGTELAHALKSALNEVENHYVHDECATEWSDTYSCEVDDECPSCQCDMSPARSDWMREVDVDASGIWRLYCHADRYHYGDRHTAGGAKAHP